MKFDFNEIKEIFNGNHELSKEFWNKYILIDYDESINGKTTIIERKDYENYRNEFDKKLQSKWFEKFIPLGSRYFGPRRFFQIRRLFLVHNNWGIL